MTSPATATAPTLHHFRTALGMFATGVTIITTCDADGQKYGLTANSFNSVSLEPPLVLWSLAHTSSALDIFRHCTHYAIHVLSVKQRSLAERFATRDIDRWAGVAHQRNAHGVPLIEGAGAVFECASRSQYVEGDHTIFVGQVDQCSHRPHTSPLLYHAGMFYAEHPLGKLSEQAHPPMSTP